MNLNSFLAEESSIYDSIHFEKHATATYLSWCFHHPINCAMPSQSDQGMMIQNEWKWNACTICYLNIALTNIMHVCLLFKNSTETEKIRRTWSLIPKLRKEAPSAISWERATTTLTARRRSKVAVEEERESGIRVMMVPCSVSLPPNSWPLSPAVEILETATLSPACPSILIRRSSFGQSALTQMIS